MSKKKKMSESAKPITAAVLIIGNEILSGRTLDKNANYIAQKLTEKGVRLMEVRTIPDIAETVIATVNELRHKFDYLFTTGGIGPTHDDITAECISRAFDVPYEQHPQAYEVLLAHYGGVELTDARLKMAKMPKDATLIPNPVSGAPGFNIGNVYTMAGVPKIMQAMMDHIATDLAGGDIVHSKTITCGLRESELADELTDLQNKHPDIDIGSYPRYAEGQFSLSVVLRGTDVEALETLAQEVQNIADAKRG